MQCAGHSKPPICTPPAHAGCFAPPLPSWSGGPSALLHLLKSCPSFKVQIKCYFPWEGELSLISQSECHSLLTTLVRLSLVPLKYKIAYFILVNFHFFRVTNAAINCISFVKIGKYFRVVKKKKRCVNIAGNRPTYRLFQCEGGKCSARERWEANRN